MFILALQIENLYYSILGIENGSGKTILIIMGFLLFEFSSKKA